MQTIIFLTYLQTCSSDPQVSTAVTRQESGDLSDVCIILFNALLYFTLSLDAINTYRVKAPVFFNV